MGEKVAIGIQSFEKLRMQGLFYIDKTEFAGITGNTKNSFNE